MYFVETKPTENRCVSRKVTVSPVLESSDESSDEMTSTPISGKPKAEFNSITESSLNVTETSFSQRLTKDKVVKVVIEVSSGGQSSGGKDQPFKGRKKTLTKRKPVPRDGRFIHTRMFVILR